MFFVRNHNAVPNIDGDEWELDAPCTHKRIEANPDAGIMKTRSFTLKDLKEKFPQSEVISTLQCAGNRQEEFITPDRPLYVSPHWRGAAIGNAKWKGVRVRDVLKECGMDVDGYALGTK
eukprot:gene32441-3442_t